MSKIDVNGSVSLLFSMSLRLISYSQTISILVFMFKVSFKLQIYVMDQFPYYFWFLSDHISKQPDGLNISFHVQSHFRLQIGVNGSVPYYF